MDKKRVEKLRSELQSADGVLEMLDTQRVEAREKVDGAIADRVRAESRWEDALVEMMRRRKKYESAVKEMEAENELHRRRFFFARGYDDMA